MASMVATHMYRHGLMSEKPENQYKARYGPSGHQIWDYIIRADIEEVADHITQS